MAKIWHKIKDSATIMTWSSQFVNIGSALFILPLLLTKFDELEISFWFLVNVFIQLARLADSGFGPTLIRAVSYFKAGAKDIPRNKAEYKMNKVQNAEPNLEKLKILYNTSSKIYFYLSIGATFLMSTIGVLVTWNIFTKSGFRLDFIISFILIIINSYLLLQTVKLISFMTGLDYVAKTNGFNAILGVIKIFMYVLILLIQPSVLLLLIYNLITAIALYVYLFRFIKKWFLRHNIQINKDIQFDKKIFKTIWPASWKMGVISWGAYLINYGSSIIVAQIDNVSLMASFLFTQRVIFIVRRVSEAPFYANIPKVYTLMARKKLQELKQLVSVYIFLSISMISVSLLVIGYFGNIILTYLNIETLLVEGPIYVLLCLIIILEIHSTMHASMYTSTNQIPFLIPALVAGVLIISLGFYILPIYGLLGVVASQFIIQFVFNYWFPVYLLLRLIKWPLNVYVIDLFRYGFEFLFSKVNRIRL